VECGARLLLFFEPSSQPAHAHLTEQ
jgi:hypothetical protein